ncbi:MAG: 50S ribosomal protein L24 [Planctomycetes bacterium]|nr:50S ribosomal protein L24 [Planctomycetota bacterium]
MKIKRGDRVVIIAGSDRAEGEERARGKIVKRVDHKKDRLIVQGSNLVKRHIRKGMTYRGERFDRGQIINQENWIHVSNVQLCCPKCGPVKVKIERTELPENPNRPNGPQFFKKRVCKKCGHGFDEKPE